MKIPTFQSPLAPFMKELIETRHALGYCDPTVAYRLAHFDRFLVSRGHDDPSLTRQLVEDWASSDGPIKPITRQYRIQAARALARLLAQTRPDTYIPGPSWGPSRSVGFRPHIYTPAEIQALLAEAAKLPTTEDPLRPKTFVTLIALLYSTGLRISEALGLELRDVDLEEGVLWIRDSKFHKSRMVPLHPTAVSALAQYRKARRGKGLRRDPEAPFFVNAWKRPYSPDLACRTFLGIARRAGIRKPPGAPGPRVHDLRHSFAVSRLMAWYQDGQDVQARLPLLSTYLGHVNIASTQVYLDISAELLQEAAQRFKAPAAPQPPTHGGHP